MLDRLRESIEPIVRGVARLAVKTRLPPLAWSAIGLLAAIISALFYWGWPAQSSLLAGLFYLLAGAMDMIDGSVARLKGSVSKFGALMDSTIDRLVEIAAFTGIVAGGLASPTATMLAASLSLTVSYTRARAESLGVNLAGFGVGERAERMIVLSALSILAYVEIAIYLVAILAALTTVQRLWRTAAVLTRS